MKRFLWFFLVALLATPAMAGSSFNGIDKTSNGRLVVHFGSQGDAYVNQAGGSFIGTVQSSTGVVTNQTTYTAFSNSLTLTFTPTKTGNYKISTVPTCDSATASIRSFFRIQPTSGSPTTIFSQEVSFDSGSGTNNLVNIPIPISLWRVDTLLAGSAYTYTLQAHADNATSVINCFFGFPTNGTVLIAESLN